jgi:hypothetical protein
VISDEATLTEITVDQLLSLPYQNVVLRPE